MIEEIKFDDVTFDFSRIVKPLLKWFRTHARELAWRSDPTPYHVWVSEIMLQQTRVEAVKSYYARFIRELPDIEALAECEEEKLLKLWEGLGYYNRVRNMQNAAKELVQNFNGELPADYDKLLSLKGIGNYTAGAIASIAYKIPVPAVDGNVLRVLTRVSGSYADIAKASVRKEVEKKLIRIIPPNEPDLFNQALMELGALVCVPNGEPHCTKCPWREFCVAANEKKTAQIPVKTKAKSRRLEEKTVFIIRRENKVVLNKRPQKGLLAGLYELPNTSGKLEEEEALEWVKKQKLKPIKLQKAEDAKHIFSHVEWDMTGYVVWIDELSGEESDFLYVDVEETRNRYPIPSAFKAYIKYIQNYG